MVLGITDQLKKVYTDFFTAEEEKAKRYKQIFTEAYHKFKPDEPLVSESDLKFCIPQGENYLKDLKTHFDLNSNSEEFEKYLFTGQKGCGKTTELNYWASQLKERFTIIICSVKDIIKEPNDIQYSDILLLISIKLLQKLVQLKKAQPLSQKIDTYFKLINKNTPDQSEEEASKNLDLVLERICLDSATRKAFREKAEANRIGLFNAINEAAGHIAEATQKQPFVFVDDIDKMDVEPAINLLENHASLLVEPRCKIIYTIPLTLFYYNDFSKIRRHFNDFFHIALVRIYDKKNKENGKGIDQFVKIVDKRIKSKELFDEEVLNDLIIRTGGIINNLIGLVRECCFELIKKPKRKIDDETLKIVMDRRKAKLYRMLSVPERSVIRKVYVTKNPQDVPKEFVTHFLNEGLVLEQVDFPVPWFDIHPALRALLGVAEEPGYENI